MTANQAATLLLLLLAGHAAGDYSLQTTYMALGKNRHLEEGKRHWPEILLAHSLVHAGLACLVTYLFVPQAAAAVGWSELGIHFLIDWRKCEGDFGFRQDQALHVLCKLFWWATALSYAAPHAA